MTKFNVVTVVGVNPSVVGESLCSLAESSRWFGGVARCDSEGTGRVLIECGDEDADYLRELMDEDERVKSYR